MLISDDISLLLNFPLNPGVNRLILDWVSKPFGNILLGLNINKHITTSIVKRVPNVVKTNRVILIKFFLILIQIQSKIN